jgi:hypothetical protein
MKKATILYRHRVFFVLENEKYVEYDPLLHDDHYVTCSVTGKDMPLSKLFYWSVTRQESYINATVSLQRELEIGT